MSLGSHLPAPAGVKESQCESPCVSALLVACVGGSGGEGSGSQRLQWFACCTCEACYPSRTGYPCGPCDHSDPCQPCDACYPCQPCGRYGSSPDLSRFCTPNAFPRWRRLPPLPPTNPHSDPACYGAVAAAVPGTGIAIVGGALPSQSGRPQHVRHVSVFDWHMGAWFDVQQPCMLPRLDPVVAAIGAMGGGERDCLVVVGGCAVPSFPRASTAGSCGRVAVCASETGVAEKQHPVCSRSGASPNLPRGSGKASPSNHSRHPFLGMCTMCIDMPMDGFGADECDSDKGRCGSSNKSTSNNSRGSTSDLLSGCALTQGGGSSSSGTQQYYQFPRLDSLVLGGRVFVRRHISRPCFGLNPVIPHAPRPAPPDYTAHGPGNRFTGTGGSNSGSGNGSGINSSGSYSSSSMVSEAGVLEVDRGSPVMWRVVEESDSIHAIWTRQHIAQVIGVDVTGTGDVTVPGVTGSDVTAKPAAAEDSTEPRSSKVCQASLFAMLPPPPGALSSTAAVHPTHPTHATHAASATYSVLCSLDPSLSLLVFNHLQQRWVPAGPRLSSPFPPCPPLPRPSPHVLYPCGRGSHGGYCSTPPYPLVPPFSTVPPCTPTAPFSSHAPTLTSRLPSCGSSGAPSSLVAGSNAAAATSASAAATASSASAASSAGTANLGRLRQLVGCGSRLMALFQPHDTHNPHDPGVMREILLPDLHALSSLSALLPHTSSSFPHLPSSLPSLQPSLFALSQPPPTVGPAPPQAQASESVSVAAAGGLMRLVSSGNVESRIGWAIGAPVALPGNGRLHHVLSVAI
ncbi:unnamed protein product [Closterium sp. NIES-53]